MFASRFNVHVTSSFLERQGHIPNESISPSRTFLQGFWEMKRESPQRPHANPDWADPRHKQHSVPTDNTITVHGGHDKH
jgi:hypothetical protein